MPASKSGLGAKNSPRAVPRLRVVRDDLVRRRDRRQRRLAREVLRRQHLQRPDVVENPDAAAVRAEDERVVARMNDEIVDRHGRQVRQRATATSTSGRRRSRSARRARGASTRKCGSRGCSRIRLTPVSGRPAHDRAPRLAVVVAHVDVRLVVVVVVAVERRVDAAGGVARRQHGAARRCIAAGREIFDVTFVHVLPPSRVTCTVPSCAPV